MSAPNYNAFVARFLEERYGHTATNRRIVYGMGSFFRWYPELGVYWKQRAEAIEDAAIAYVGQRYARVNIYVLRAILRSMCAPAEVRELSYDCWLSPGHDHGQYRAFRNGLVKMDDLLAGRPGTLIPHTPEWFSTTILDYDYDPQATCPSWEEAVKLYMEGDEERVQLIQEFFGYIFLPAPNLQKWMLWVGEGGNGKSTAINVLREVVGRENCSEESLQQLAERDSPYETLGALVNISRDTGSISAKACEIIKDLVDAERFSFQTKYVKKFRAKPTAKILAALNRMSRFSDTSEGWWRKMIIVPWNVDLRRAGTDDTRFLSPETPNWPFAQEKAGIFNWAMRGAARLIGRGSFQIPVACEDLAHKYRFKNNSIQQFFDEKCAVVPEAPPLPFQTIYRRYVEWALERNRIRLDDAEFGEIFWPLALKAGAEKVRPSANNRVRCVRGLALTPEP